MGIWCKDSSSAVQSSGEPAAIEQAMFKFQDLEITRNTLVMRFLDESTTIQLKDVESYSLKWYLHDPTFAKKYWFLVLTVEPKNGQEESGPIAVAKFNYFSDEHELRQRIESRIAEAINLALSRCPGAAQK